MCLRFEFCTHQRVCVPNFLLENVRFVVPYYTVRYVKRTFLYPSVERVLKVSLLSAFSYEYHDGCSLPRGTDYI
jgi:hypothetical protein